MMGKWRENILEKKALKVFIVPIDCDVVQYAAPLPAALRGSDAAVIVPSFARATTVHIFRVGSKIMDCRDILTV
jgi:hypothetical protein